MLTALIADDEYLARAYLRSLLEEQNVVVVGEASDAVEALEKVEMLKPQVIFLDIQMPGLNGLQLADALRRLDVSPLPIFVTGYSEHAVSAFERDAADYLLKPVSPERLLDALTRARRRLTPRTPQSVVTTSRIPVRGDYAIKLLRVEDLVCAISRDRKVYLRTRDGVEHRALHTLIQIEKVLPESQFYRIHDSSLVALDHVEELLFLGNHEYEVRLTGGIRLPVGRSRYTELRRHLGLERTA